MKIDGKTIILDAGEEITIKASEGQQPDGRMLFDGMLRRMNEVLRSYGFREVKESATPKTYSMLYSLWGIAAFEWSTDGSWMFDRETYPDLIEMHGDDVSHADDAYNAMQAWMMASQLAELCPTSGGATNCQTDLFKLAYGLGGGAKVPLFGLEIHSDPMIARLVGGVLYEMYHESIPYSEYDRMREELGGHMIEASDWDGLGYEGTERKMEVCGYLVNSDVIIPAAPGPFADGCDGGRPKPWEQGQPEDQFCLSNSDGMYEWWRMNYIKDIFVDDHVVKNYNIGAQTSRATWDGYPYEVRQRILEAVAASRATDNFFYGKKLIRFDGIHDGTRRGQYTNYTYFWFSEVDRMADGVIEVGGPFADLHDIMFKGGGYGQKTDTLLWFKKCMDIFDNSRCPTFANQYGRRRPCGGAAGDGRSARSPINGDPLNALYNIDMSCIFADDQKNADKWAAEDGFVTEKPKSYPSGHAAQVWGVAMILAQMLGDDTDRIRRYMQLAWRLGVNRTVNRAHWNSDVIYGRLFATMALPLINAMRGMRDGYEKAESVINGEEPEVTPGKVVTFNVIIKNSRSQAVTLDDKINFVVANPDVNGFYYGANGDGTPYTGFYNRWGVALVGNGKKITIPAYGSQVFKMTPNANSNIFYQNGTPYGSGVENGLGGRNLVSQKQIDDCTTWPSSRGRANVLLYVDGDSNVVVPQSLDSNIFFEEGGTYTVVIK